MVNVDDPMSDATGEAKKDVAHGAGPRVRDSAKSPAHEASLLDALITRLDLAVVELEIQLRAMLTVVLWTVCAIACALLAVGFTVATLVVALWNTHRLLALLSGSLVFAALAVGFGFLGTRRVDGGPR